MSIDALRGAAAASTVFAYAALCVSIWWREQRRRASDQAAASALTGTAASPALVVFGTQTGQAEALAWQTARRLHAGGTPVRVLSLNAVDADMLRTTPRALFVASTYGEGDAPDGVSRLRGAAHGRHRRPALALSRLHAVLALGDRQYAEFLRLWPRDSTPGLPR